MRNFAGLTHLRGSPSITAITTSSFSGSFLPTETSGRGQVEYYQVQYRVLVIPSSIFKCAYEILIVVRHSVFRSSRVGNGRRQPLVSYLRTMDPATSRWTVCGQTPPCTCASCSWTRTYMPSPSCPTCWCARRDNVS